MTTPEKHSPAARDASPDGPPATPESAQTTPTSTERPLPRVLAAGRPRLVEAVVQRDRGWNAVVRVVVERGGDVRTAERQAVGEEAVVLRSVAEATLDAVGALAGGEQTFALVGVKRLLAFDSAVLLVCVRTVDGPPRKLIGCVPVQDDPVIAVARSVMHATNRIVESMANEDPPLDDKASTEDGDARDAAADSTS